MSKQTSYESHTADHDLLRTSAELNRKSQLADYDANGQGAGPPFESSTSGSLAMRSGLNRLADYDSPGLETNREVREQEIGARIAGAGQGLADSDLPGRETASRPQASGSSPYPDGHENVRRPDYELQPRRLPPSRGADKVKPQAAGKERLTSVGGMVPQAALFAIFEEMQPYRDEFYQHDRTPRTPAVNARLKARGLTPVSWEGIISAYEAWKTQP